MFIIAKKSKEESPINQEDSPSEQYEPTFIPIIKGAKVIELNINGGKLPLKESISFNEFTEKLMPILIDLSKYVDVSIFATKKKKSAPIITKKWDEKSLKSYLKDLNERQIQFIKIISENEEIPREELIEELVKVHVLENDDSLKSMFNGLSAGFSRKWNSQGFEPLWSIKKDLYIVNPDIADLLKNNLEELNI